MITQCPFKSKSWEHTSSPGAESQAPAWKESFCMARNNMQFDFLRKMSSQEKFILTKVGVIIFKTGPTDTLHDKVLCWMGDCRSHSRSATNGPFCKSFLRSCSLHREPCPTDTQKERECYLLTLHNVKFWIVSNPNSLEETSICRPKFLYLSGCQVLSLRKFLGITTLYLVKHVPTCSQKL